MKTLFLSVALGAGLLLSAGVYADAPPAGAIAQCKDGTYFTGTSHSGACKGHQGVKEWLDKDKTAAPTATPKASTSKSSASSTSATTSDTSTSKKTKSKKTSDAAAAPATASDTSKTSKASKTTAAAPATTSAGPIAKCKDGTTFNGTSHKGACRGHKGVAQWLDTGSATAATPATKAAPAAAPAATATPTPAPAPAPKAAPASAPAATAAPATAPAAASTETKRTPPTPASQITQKAGGGPGLVWVNAESKVYHCQGDEWYGKTKEGSYMSEAAAKTGGNRAARGKECSQ